MNDNKNKILVLGLGSDILSDEGIGVRIVKKVRTTDLNIMVDFTSLDIGSPEIIEIIKDYQKVIFIDAIKTKRKEIGEFHVFNVENFVNTINLSNPHDLGFIDTLTLGKVLYEDFPDDILIIAVEIEKEFEISNKLSNKLSIKMSKLVNDITYIIKNEVVKFKEYQI